ncbi:hypothetical protein SAMN04487910_1482 [Aquimarina amphilecti]|uniref:Uncharacterized protein n=1 Tax=Aquimarina amphilecti TaxID=1038014 RepID=A0A1H7L0N0_AQUAM|nr:hypothetical protein [Aquimarina amphilecti]SEK92276.1 hypothetical protein SAMN04487910_1482 [Aquimarina amphilecti]
MERTEELFEKIERYLDKTLSEEVTIAFEKEMSTNPELKLEVDKHRELHNVLSNKDVLDFKEKLQKIGEEVKKEKLEETKTSFFPYLKIAASVVILIGAGTLLWNTFNSSNDFSNLYTSYYELYPVEDVTRGDVLDQLDIVMKNYAQGNHDKVITELEENASLVSSEQLELYLGNSYLQVGKEKKALLQFEKINDNSQYYEDANWYQALTYLKLGETNTSLEILERIIRFDGIYKEKAIQLKEDLE